jgi:hypothetical protein
MLFRIENPRNGQPGKLRRINYTGFCRFFARLRSARGLIGRESGSRRLP